jgi:hypothetical protein
VIPPDDYLDEHAQAAVERDIEVETEMAIERVLADAIKAEMIERFRDRYDLEGLREHVERSLEEQPRESWRGVVGRRIGDQGRTLRDEIEDAVREYIEQEEG